MNKNIKCDWVELSVYVSMLITFITFMLLGIASLPIFYKFNEVFQAMLVLSFMVTTWGLVNKICWGRIC